MNEMLGMKSDLKNIFKMWSEEYRVISARSRDEEIRNSKPGAVIPAEGKIYGETNKEEFKALTMKRLEESEKVIEKELVRINKAMSEAPKDEAVRALTVLSLSAPKEPITDPAKREAFANEIDILMNEYGGNYLSYQTLRNFAANAGAYDFKEHDLMKEAHACNDAKRLVNSYMDPVTVIHDGLSDGAKAMFVTAVDGLGLNIF